MDQNSNPTDDESVDPLAVELYRLLTRPLPKEVEDSDGAL